MGKEKTYAAKQLELLGVNQENNIIDTMYHPTSGEKSKAVAESWYNHRFVDLTEEMIKSEPDLRNAKGVKPGDLLINFFDLYNRPYDYKIPNRATRQRYRLVRLQDPIKTENGEKKYHLPYNADTTRPYIPFSIVEKFQKKEKIRVLVLTEGAKKAFYAAEQGLDIVAFNSITHYTNKKKKTLHPEIGAIIENCSVEHVIMLYDGDASNISLKAFSEMKDLSTRPRGFYNSMENIRMMLDSYVESGDGGFRVWFSAINSKDIDGNPKGLDDLLIQEKESVNDIIGELTSFEKKGGHYFTKIDRTYSNERKLQQFLGLNNVETFIQMHEDIIKRGDFKFKGNYYTYDGVNQTWIIKTPKEASLYIRVGDDFFEHCDVPDADGNTEHQLLRRQKATITMDHGKDIFQHISKYKAFTTIPNHIEYEPVFHGCWNMYYPLSHEPEEGDCENIINLVKHIFQDKWEVGLDYLQLLYQKPTEKLPILVLTSQENETGKSTFIQLTKMMFENNAAIVSNEDLSNPFNSHWASKLLICCEETLIDKKPIVEKIKGLSTGKKIIMNAKGRDQNQVDFFGKFIFASNNDDDAIYVTRHDTRYFVLTVPKIKEKIHDMEDKLRAEINAFLHFLQSRKMKYPEKQGRMWFPFEAYRTKAIEKMIEHSLPTVVKEVKSKLAQLFLESDEEEILMDATSIRTEFFGKNSKFEQNYIAKELRKHLNVDVYKEWYHNKKWYTADGRIPPDAELRSKTKRFSFPRIEEKIVDDTQSSETTKVLEKVIISKTGRPFIFKREDFVDDDDLNIDDIPKTTTDEEDELPF